MRISLNAADRLSLSFLAFLSLIVVLFIPALPSWPRLLGTYFILAAGLLAVAGRRLKSGRDTTVFYFHIAFTVIMILVIFNSIGDLIAGLYTGTYDRFLVGIDYALFGVHPTVWMEKFINPALTAVLQFAYISYYFMPVALGTVLIRKGRHEAFEHALFGIVLCFYLSYIGYLLVPAIGPRFILAGLQTGDLQAGPLITTIQETLNRLEHNKTDAFPSGHTAIALLTLYYAWNLKERTLFRVLVPMAALLMISTVYLRYHYVIDVIAGVALACLAIRTAPRFEVWFSSTAGKPGDKRHYSA